FFQSMITIAVVAWGLLMVADQAYRPKKHFLNYVVLFFGAVALLTTITGVDAHRSFWANHERMIGSFFTLHLVALYFVATSVFTTQEAWRRVWKMFLGIGFLIIGSAIIQHWKPDFLFGGQRAASTLGNPLYLGLHAVYVAFIAALLFFEGRADGSLKERWQMGVLWLLVILSFIAFVFSETRGVAVGLGAAMVWMLAWIAAAGRKRAYRWSALGLLVIMVLGIAAVTLFNQHPALNSIPVVRRFSGFSLGGTNANRLFAGNVAIDAWKDKPILGWGPFNYVYAFNQKYQGTQLVHNNFGETWFDNAHNFFLDTAAEQGVVGFAAYLLLLIAPLVLFIRGWYRGHIPLSAMTLISALIITHAVQNIFAFEQVSSYASLFMVLAYVHYRAVAHASASRADAPRKSLTPGVTQAIGGALIIGGAVLLYTANVVPFRANALMFNGLNVLELQKDASIWFGIEKKAIELGGPYTDHVREELARTLLRIRVPDGQRSAMVDLFKYTIAQQEEARRRHPLDPVYTMLLGELWYGAYFIAPNDFPRGIELGDQAFAEAIKVSPERQQLYLLWAEHVGQAGLFAKGLDQLKKARSFAPHSAFMLKLYADYLERAGINAPERAYLRWLSIQLSPSMLGAVQDELISFELIKWVSARAGVDRLQALLTCAGHDTGVACADPSFENTDYRPSEKLFQVLVGYFKEQKDVERVRQYTELAQQQYPGIILPEVKVK
ncbi:MAG: O-antigen ligase family protein, partial [Patescibacteria group bacterium]